MNGTTNNLPALNTWLIDTEAKRVLLVRQIDADGAVWCAGTMRGLYDARWEDVVAVHLPIDFATPGRMVPVAVKAGRPQLDVKAAKILHGSHLVTAYAYARRMAEILRVAA